MPFPSQPDLGIDSENVLLLEAEIDTLMRRFVELDANAILRLERLLSRLKIERAVEKHCH